MSIYCPQKYIKPVKNINEELMQLQGSLTDKDAKITLAQFLYSNLGFTTELISGIKLAAYQEITLKSWFKRNFSMCIWGRGCAKSFCMAVFGYLYPLFHPGSKVLIAAPTFRSSRLIFNKIEEIAKSKGALLLKQCFTEDPSHKNDLYSWSLGNGSII